MKNKRDRSANWEKEEKHLLREIIKPYIQVIENKNLSTNINKEKVNAWTEITEKFNVINIIPRSKKQIVNQWKITKLNSKKEIIKHRHEISQTGGGPPPPSPTIETLELVDLLPQEFEVDYNEFDCDGVKDNKNITQKENVDLSFKKNILNDHLDLLSNDGEIDVGVNTFDSPYELPQPITPKRTVKKKPQMTNKMNFNFAEASYNDMHQFRVMENERIQKEHELRVKHMGEVHAHVLTNLKLQEKILAKTLASLNK